MYSVLGLFGHPKYMYSVLGLFGHPIQCLNLQLMRLLMLNVVADGLEVWLILGYVKFHIGVHPSNEIVGLS